MWIHLALIRNASYGATTFECVNRLVFTLMLRILDTNLNTCGFWTAILSELFHWGNFIPCSYSVLLIRSTRFIKPVEYGRTLSFGISVSISTSERSRTSAIILFASLLSLTRLKYYRGCHVVFFLVNFGISWPFSFILTRKTWTRNLIKMWYESIKMIRKQCRSLATLSHNWSYNFSIW